MKQLLKDLAAIALSCATGGVIGWLICNIESIRWVLAVISGLAIVYWLSVRIGQWLGCSYD